MLRVKGFWFRAKETAKAAKAAADTVLAINQQIGIMEQQTAAAVVAASAAQRSADAAKLSANGLIDSERAWILIEIGTLPDFDPVLHKNEHLWVMLMATNFRKTFA